VFRGVKSEISFKSKQCPFLFALIFDNYAAETKTPFLAIFALL
jgi:hypothetical protein